MVCPQRQHGPRRDRTSALSLIHRRPERPAAIASHTSVTQRQHHLGTAHLRHSAYGYGNGGNPAPDVGTALTNAPAVGLGAWVSRQ